MVDIDFVIPWVDGSDEKWLREKAIYSGTNEVLEAKKISRYRDWDLLRYWFRGIDKYTPWVRKVHFITCGHLPEWLNTDCEKLHITTHESYIPKEYLPTFSSHPIELNIHRIDDLAEQFVYFNDDTFLIKPTKPECFFKNGLPCATAILTPSRVVKGDWFTAAINNVAIINEHFNAHKVVASNLTKWLNPKYGKYLLATLAMLPYPVFYGFFEYHLPNSYLKSYYEKIWKEEYQIMHETSQHKFRDRSDVNQWLIENWQMADGKFVPRNPNFGTPFYLTNYKEKQLNDLCSYIEQQKGHVVCVNDGDMSDEAFETAKARVTAAFETILPEKSQFEI